MASVATEQAGRRPRRLLPAGRVAGIVIACLLIVVNSIYSLVALRALQRANGWVSHSQEVQLQLDDVLSLVQDATGGQRGYLLTGDERFLAAYRAAHQQVARAIETTRALTADNPDQQQRIAALETAANDVLDRLADGIARRERGETGIAAAELTANKARMDRIRALTAEMEDAEAQLYRQRSAEANARAAEARYSLIFGTLGSLLLIALIFRLIQGEARRSEALVRERTAELAGANASLRGEIASRAKAESELRRTRAFLDTVIENIPGMVFVKDARDHRYLLFNRGGEELLGHERGELVGKSDHEIFPRAQADHFVERDRAALAAGAMIVTVEETATRRKGVRILETKKLPVLDEEGRPQYILGFSEDITDRLATEQQLRQAQKMEAIGQLTGGVAHDFNNILAVILGNAELLLDLVGDRPEAAELANVVMNGALRGAELTRRLLAFARKQVLQPQVIDLNERLPGIVEMLRRTLGETIHVTATPGEGLWRTRADPSQVEDALVNLAINARDAMPKGGDLTIATANAHLDEHYAAQHVEVKPGDYVMLSVTDTGIGMAPEIVERATEPFFTTKESGKGTGLGLSMIYGFAKQSGGHLKIYSEPGYGTTVKLYLPRVEGEARGGEAAARTAPPLPGGDETILLVEDNPHVREVAKRQLVDLGYKVRTAESGPAALAVLESDEPIDLLFTDVVMPEGMTGYELAEAARQIHPRLKVLFTTGYERVQSRNGNGHPDPAHMIRKPYRKQELAEKVRAALDDEG
ncbi:MAG TPA: CHASE3 domain-containing protein [Alphaproteobacteria bacterium]|nr:CHASE3 domain-containing protein [Alphaproteobacteria bacterium]